MIAGNNQELEIKFQAVLAEHGYSKTTVNSMRRIVRKLIYWHDEQGEDRLIDGIITSFLDYEETRYRSGAVTRTTFLMHKTVIEYLTQIYSTGTIIHKRRSHLPILPNYFEGILSEILSKEEWSLRFREGLSNRIGTFFRWLCSHGYSDLSRVDETIVRKYLANCSDRMVGGSLDVTRRALRELFRYISEDGMLSESMNKLFLFSVRIDKKMQPFMPQDEIASVLYSIDRSTVLGKRDYAIILLAAVTGLRACDIVRLTLDSVDWRNGEIRIVQGKTGNALALPLTVDVGESICEYILNARPNSKSDKIFLNSRAPFSEMQASTLTTNFQRYCDKAEVTSRRGFHSLRRSVATNMVTSGVSVVTVAQTLGHATIDSTKQYISLDSKNLKECALFAVFRLAVVGYEDICKQVSSHYERIS
jgi:site-specific recombinase XerD